jgi:acylphosphatase
MPSPDGSAPISGEDHARLEAVVRGRVQAVGFRYFVLREAARLGLSGWVANEADGSVRCVAEGTPADLAALLAALRRGPPAARVDRVVETWLDSTGSLDGFTVRSGGHSGD